MNHSRLMRLIAMTVAIMMVLTLGMLGGCKSEEPATDESGASGTWLEGEAPEDGEMDTAEPGTEEGEVPETAEAPTEMTVSLFWVEAGENALGVPRTVPYSIATGRAAMEALLEGPTDGEQTTWPAISTAIPEGTELLGLTISNGIAKVDLSEEFDDGGGTFGVTARLAQVVYTLCQFSTVDSVEFYMEGEKVDIFSGEGLILDGPQTPEDYYDLLPIDA